MKQFEIYYNDLNDNAKKRYIETLGDPHDNIDLSPMAIIELEDDVLLAVVNKYKYKGCVTSRFTSKEPHFQEIDKIPPSMQPADPTGSHPANAVPHPSNVVQCVGCGLFKCADKMITTFRGNFCLQCQAKM